MSPPGSINDNSGHRFVGGGQVGYNLQTGFWVYGVEADISAGRRRIGTNATASIPLSLATAAINVPAASFGEAEVDWYGTLRARLGIARDRWLVYVTGGVAYGELKVTNTGNFQVIAIPGGLALGSTASVTTSHRKAGWAAGAGTAYAWSDTVSLFAEWTRIDLGSQSAETSSLFIVPGPPPIAFGQSARSDVVGRFDVIQVGVNLKFN